MPIRPENRSRYPINWHPRRDPRARRQPLRRQSGLSGRRNGEPIPGSGKPVVLTVAHLDHQPENCDPSNLRAWCQRYHLTYDAEHHRRNAARTRRSRLAVGDMLGRGEAGLNLYGLGGVIVPGICVHGRKIRPRGLEKWNS